MNDVMNFIAIIMILQSTARGKTKNLYIDRKSSYVESDRVLRIFFSRRVMPQAGLKSPVGVEIT